MNPLAQLAELGQSVWYDYIRRDLMESGALARMIEEDGLRGMTSNPTIFQGAIAKSDLYDADIRAAGDDETPAALFERIAVAEIQRAADEFRPVFDKADGGDGHVSIEVSPTLARDTDGTITEARRLWKACGRDNVMIKIPGTAEGLPAIETCISEGINVNVTLLFGVERYREVMDAWMRGLEARAARGEPIDRVASVASFFVSRVDGSVDKLLAARRDAADGPTRERIDGLRSTVGIANARLAYAAWGEAVRDHARFAALKAKGAMAQRPLWASTSTKDPMLPDVLYVEALAAPDSVNTVPPNTYEAFKDHGDARIRIHDDLDQARAAIDALADLGIDFAAVTRDLEEDGIKKFADSYEELLQAIAEKRASIQAK